MAVGGGGGGGGSAAIKAGAAYVELFTNDTKLAAGLKAAQRRLASFGASMAKAGAVTLGTAGGLLTGTSLKALDTLGDTSRMSAAADAFGLTAEAASRLFGIMGSAGSDIRDATEGIVTLGQRVSDALSGKGEEAADLFTKLGVGAKEFAGLAPDQQFYKLLDALRAVQDPALRVQLLLKSVGEDTGKNLIPLLGQSAEEVRALGERFEVSAADMRKAKEATAAYAKSTALIQQAWLQVSVALAPTLTQMAGWFTSVITPVTEFIKQNRVLITTAVLVTAGVAAAGAAFVAIGAAAAGAGAVIGAIGAAASMILSPLGLATAAVAALGLTVFTQTSVFDGFLGGFLRAFQGVRDALTAGDLALAGRVAMTGLNLAWQEGLDVMSRAWRSFARSLTDVMTTASFQVKNTYRDLTTGVAAVLIDVLNSVGVYSDKEAKQHLRNLWKENDALKRKAAAEQARITAGLTEARAREDAEQVAAGNPALIAARMAHAFALARAEAARKEAEKPAAAEQKKESQLTAQVAGLSKSAGAFLGGANATQVFGQGVSVQQQQLAQQKKAATGIDNLNKAVDTLPRDIGDELDRRRPVFT